MSVTIGTGLGSNRRAIRVAPPRRDAWPARWWRRTAAVYSAPCRCLPAGRPGLRGRQFVTIRRIKAVVKAGRIAPELRPDHVSQLIETPNHLVAEHRPAERSFGVKSWHVHGSYLLFSLASPSWRTVTLSCSRLSPVIVRRHLGDQEGKLLGHIDAAKVLLRDISVAIGVRENDIDNLPYAAEW